MEIFEEVAEQEGLQNLYQISLMLILKMYLHQKY